MLELFMHACIADKWLERRQQASMSVPGSVSRAFSSARGLPLPSLATAHPALAGAVLQDQLGEILRQGVQVLPCQQAIQTPVHR